ncbi:MAG: phycobiliprotein lyase [Iphinoe sp. HA4291-MV1]|jgi:hypothetical protein|nr:phycobiliprotein lyase [Iphinoe sp. HA4291-MV1]
MNIEEFFELSAGKWFSHRTSHDLACKQSENGKSDTIIERLSSDHPEVVKLCQQYNVDHSPSCYGAKVTWNATMAGNEKKQTGSTVFVAIPDQDNPNEGKFLRAIDSPGKPPVVGRYKIGTDDALTFTTEYETVCYEERLWFASPNLRMRVSVVKRIDGFSTASFTSEIRMGGGQPTVKASEATNSALS